jgi:hypothetical protein
VRSFSSGRHISRRRSANRARHEYLRPAVFFLHGVCRFLSDVSVCARVQLSVQDSCLMRSFAFLDQTRLDGYRMTADIKWRHPGRSAQGCNPAPTRAAPRHVRSWLVSSTSEISNCRPPNLAREAPTTSTISTRSRRRHHRRTTRAAMARPCSSPRRLRRRRL